MSETVLLVCGSLQEKSSNRALLDVVRDHLVRAGIPTEDAVDVGTMPAFNPEEQDQSAPAVIEFRAQLARSRAVVISTPEYAAALPGALKNALDWIVGSAELYGKPVALLSAGTTGGEYARSQLIRSLTWQGAHIVAHLGVAAPRTKSDTEGRIVDPETIKGINDVAQRLLEVQEMSPGQRRQLVEEVTAAAGIEPGHVSPVPEC